MKKETELKISGGEFVPPEAIGAKDIKDIIDNPFDLPLLSEYLGTSKSRDACLIHFSIDTAKYGEFAILEFVNGSGKYRCNSKPVIEQIKKLLATGIIDPVNVHVAKKKNETGQEYYSLLG